jgi:hypothetical protein
VSPGKPAGVTPDWPGLSLEAIWTEPPGAEVADGETGLACRGSGPLHAGQVVRHRPSSAAEETRQLQARPLYIWASITAGAPQPFYWDSAVSDERYVMSRHRGCQGSIGCYFFCRSANAAVHACRQHEQREPLPHDQPSFRSDARSAAYRGKSQGQSRLVRDSQRRVRPTTLPRRCRHRCRRRSNVYAPAPLACRHHTARIAARNSAMSTAVITVAPPVMVGWV